MQKIEKVLLLFDSEPDAEEYVDLDHFSDLWLAILIPELDNLKRTVSRKRKIYTLHDLNASNVKLTANQVDWVLENCQYSNTLDEMISACIIGIAKQQ